MLNENALKMVGPTFEEVGAKTKGTVSVDSLSLAVATVLATAYAPIVSTVTYLTYKKIHG